MKRGNCAPVVGWPRTKDSVVSTCLTTVLCGHRALASSFSGACPEHAGPAPPPCPQGAPESFPVCHWLWPDIRVCPLPLVPVDLLDKGFYRHLSLPWRTQEATTFMEEFGAPGGRIALGEEGDPEVALKPMRMSVNSTLQPREGALPEVSFQPCK